MMAVSISFFFAFFLLFLCRRPTSGHLSQNYYGNTCPEAEAAVRRVVTEMSPAAIPGTIRLLLHDCFVEGCDASIMIESNETNTAERDHPDNLSLVRAGFDTVIRAKAEVESIPGCKSQVSCADILVMAVRDAINLAGGPSYAVELGRLDGVSSTAASVQGRLPQADFDLDQLISMFGALGLSLTDVVALSGAHTIGFSRCSQFEKRFRNFSAQMPVDPTMDPSFAQHLQRVCISPAEFVGFDGRSELIFDNAYYQNLANHKGLLSSDQVLYTDPRSRPTVEIWATDYEAFAQAFVTALTKLSRVGVKTTTSGGGGGGEIRTDCTRLNQEVRMVFESSSNKDAVLCLEKLILLLFVMVVVLVFLD